MIPAFPLGLLPVLPVCELEARLEGGVLPVFVDECAAILSETLSTRGLLQSFSFYGSSLSNTIKEYI
jgi:hypothetical protein